MSSSVQGTNVPPISFPGIVSGIDYNSIINQLTKLSLAPTTALNASVATLNNANLELIKINNLLSSVQNALQNLSNPDLFHEFGATSSNTAALLASGIPGTAAIPGVYTITKVQTATATSVLSCTFAGHGITDVLTSGPYAGQHSDTVPLADSYAAVTPSNGTGSLGQITVDGVSLSYNVDTQSVDTILNNITAAVRVSADAGFLATLVGGTVEFTSSDKPISVGSNSDKGNLLDVLKLSNAQVNNAPGSGSIVGTSDVGGIDVNASLNSTTSAGYKTPVTAGFFTLNGVKITVLAGQNTTDVLNSINSSGAGVIATYDQNAGQITLTALATGPQSIVVGAGGDTSNFLSAAGLTSGSGAASQVGQQAEVDIQTAGGGTQKYFSSSNTITTAIPGIALTAGSSTIQPFTVTVSQSSTQLVDAVSTFISAYNAAVSEINNATAAPTVLPAGLGSGGNTSAVGGGVLFGNTNAQSIVQQLTQIVSGFLGSGSSYNSLSQIGIQVSNSFTQYTTANNTNSVTGSSGGNVQNGSQGQTVQATTFPGTDGTLQPLTAIDSVTQQSFLDDFLSAFNSNPTAVTNLLNGANGLTTQLGTYLTSVTGAPTLLNSGPVGNIPSVSVVQNFENSNTDAITQYQAQIKQITDSANQQANNLRSQFVASEALIAQLQAEQQQLAAALGYTISSSSSSS